MGSAGVELGGRVEADWQRSQSILIFVQLRRMGKASRGVTRLGASSIIGGHQHLSCPLCITR